MKKTNYIVCAAVMILAISVTALAKPGTISATKTGTISATKTGTISATGSGISTHGTGTISATRAGIIPTTQIQSDISILQRGFVELLLTFFQPW